MPATAGVATSGVLAAAAGVLCGLLWLASNDPLWLAMTCWALGVIAFSFEGSTWVDLAPSQLSSGVINKKSKSSALSPCVIKEGSSELPLCAIKVSEAVVAEAIVPEVHASARHVGTPVLAMEAPIIAPNVAIAAEDELVLKSAQAAPIQASPKATAAPTQSTLPTPTARPLGALAKRTTAQLSSEFSSSENPLAGPISVPPELLTLGAEALAIFRASFEPEAFEAFWAACPIVKAARGIVVRSHPKSDSPYNMFRCDCTLVGVRARELEAAFCYPDVAKWHTPMDHATCLMGPTPIADSARRPRHEKAPPATARDTTFTEVDVQASCLKGHAGNLVKPRYFLDLRCVSVSVDDQLLETHYSCARVRRPLIAPLMAPLIAPLTASDGL
jgi:hypothetical protein